MSRLNIPIIKYGLSEIYSNVLNYNMLTKLMVSVTKHLKAGKTWSKTVNGCQKRNNLQGILSSLKFTTIFLVKRKQNI